MAFVSQAAGEHSVDLTIGRIDESGQRLLASASALSDEQLREPSLLPGWSRAHVLSHLTGNADGLRNLLIWAQTGVETPQYPSQEARDKQIEERASQPAEQIVAELSRSTKEFTAQARELSGEAWTAEVRAIRGPAHPGWYTLHRRLSEVEIHHVDLAAGYASADWPTWFVEAMLYDATGRLRGNAEAPSAVLTDSDTGRQFMLQPDPGSGEMPDLAITGPGHLLLAWLLGRNDGEELSSDPDGPLPSVPPY